MKRFLTILLSVFILSGTLAVQQASAEEPDSHSTEIVNLIKSYSGEKGFDVVSIGKFGMSLMKKAAKSQADDPDSRMAVAFIEGIEKLVVIEYSDASVAQKEAFTAKAAKVLTRIEKIIEVKEDGESVNIYGSLSPDGKKIKDVIIYVPEEYSIVCLLGNIDAEGLANFSKMSDE